MSDAARDLIEEALENLARAARLIRERQMVSLGKEFEGLDLNLGQIARAELDLETALGLHAETEVLS